MKIFLKLVMLCYALLIAHHIAKAQNNQTPYVPGELIVKFKDDNSSSKTNHLATQMQAQAVEKIPALGLEIWKVNQANAKAGIEGLIEQYKDHPDIEFIEPNYLYTISDTEIVDDPEFIQQWALHNNGEEEGYKADADIDAPEAWEIQSDSSTIVVGILDTGIDWRHPDLIDNIWQNLGEDANGNGTVLVFDSLNARWIFDPEDVKDTLDNDKNGYVNDFIGWNFVDDNNQPFNYEALEAGKFVQPHGTHVAGIIAASHNNTGIAGIAPGVKIAPLKFLTDEENPSGKGADAVKALNYAVKMGMQISNNSWGGDIPMSSIGLAIQNAFENNHLFVASAGNGGEDGIGDDNHKEPYYPANYGWQNVLSVASTNSEDSLSVFSNYGTGLVHIAAPGDSIYSCLPYDTLLYGFMNGTSMAAPLVAGACALLWQKQLDLLGTVKHQNIKQVLLDNVDVMPHLLDKSESGGRLNVHKALVAALDTNYTYYRQQDSLALISIYEALGGPDWTDNGGLKVWDIYNKPIDEWDEIVLDDFGRVQSVSINFKNLNGELPPEIGALTELRSLHINYMGTNYNVGSRLSKENTLNDLIKPYNNQVDSFAYARGYQNVTGTIPEEIGNLSKLKHLTIEALKITGNIPEVIGNLKHLISLNLSGNQLTGTIPAGLMELKKLDLLSLNLNKLSGSIPAQISQLKNLSSLQVFKNQLVGIIPESIASLPLWTLDLGYNNFQGSIPYDLGSNSNLHALLLDSCAFTGSMPPSLGKLAGTNLNLNISNNQLSGCYDPDLIKAGPMWNMFDAIALEKCSYSFRCRSFTNAMISDGNNFDVPWEDFVDTEAGSCWASEITKVWPGDLNNDGKVSGDDIVFYGLAKGKTGSNRESPDEYNLNINNIENTNWEGQLCHRWDESIFGVNCKHQDANGDGVVDTLDYVVVRENMGLKNPDYKEAGNLRYVSKGFELVLEPVDGSAVGTQRAYNLFLKKIDDSETSIYGISSTIQFNAALKDAKIDFTNSCLDTLHSYKKFDIEKSTLEFALTQIDDVNISCDDVLARIVMNLEEAQSDTGDEFISFKAEAISSQANMAAGQEINETIGASAYYSSVSANGGGNADLQVSLGLSPQTCNTGGKAKAQVSGGTAPYTYLWSNGATAVNIENLTAGGYSLTVTDGNNTKAVLQFEIEEDEILEYDANGDLVVCEIETEIEVDCPVYIDFDANIIDEDNHTTHHGFYTASEYIYTSGKISTNEEVELRAGNFIQLNPGFKMENNTYLDIQLKECDEE